MLEVFHPGRIDLGVGRAPGGNPVSSEAISAPRQTIPAQYYPQQTRGLIGFMNNNMPPQHPYHNATVVPRDVGAPGVWMLGSSDGSAEMAGELGTGFVLALFIGTHDRPPKIIACYKKAFDVDEIMIVNVTHSFKPRLNCYKMLAEQFELQPATGE